MAIDALTIRTRENLAWAAGIFEGEGYIGKTNKHRQHAWGLRMGINNTDKNLLKRFQSVVGVGHMHGPQYRRNRKPIYAWQTVNFEHVQAVGALLWFWLLKRRKTMFKSLVKAYLRRKVKRTSRGWSPYYNIQERFQ